MSSLEAALAAAAEPASARVAVERLVEGRPGLAQELEADELLARGFVALADASRSLTEYAIADPSLLDPLRDPAAAAGGADRGGLRHRGRRAGRRGGAAALEAE